MPNTQEPEVRATEKFFKDAFCIDGNAEMIPDSHHAEFKIGAIVKMTDSKRGTFYIAYVEPKAIRSAYTIPESCTCGNDTFHYWNFCPHCGMRINRAESKEKNK